MAKASTYKPNSEPQILRNLSNADMARIDKQTMKTIVSPDLSTMYKLKVGTAYFYFSSIEKMQKAKKRLNKYC